MYYLRKGVEMFMGVMGRKQRRRAKKIEKKREGNREKRIKGEFRMLQEIPPGL